MRQTGRHCGLLREKVEGWVVQGVQEIREEEGRGYKGWQSYNNSFYRDYRDLLSFL